MIPIYLIHMYLISKLMTNKNTDILKPAPIMPFNTYQPHGDCSSEAIDVSVMLYKKKFAESSFLFIRMFMMIYLFVLDDSLTS